jgi:hypothetical protein
MRSVVWYILKLIHKIEQAPINYLPRFLSSPPSIKAWAQSLAFQLHTPKHTEQDLENLLHTYLDQHLMALLRRTETRVMFLAAIVVMAMVFTAPCAQAINGGTYALLLCFYEHNIYPLIYGHDRIIDQVFNFTDICAVCQHLPGCTIKSCRAKCKSKGYTNTVVDCGKTGTGTAPDKCCCFNTSATKKLID